jgi:HD-GYP domain-containing protein (c-di-GMP phosphodiesterase class II)
MSDATPPGRGSQPPTQRISIDDLKLEVGDEADSAEDGPNAFLHAWFQLFKTAKIHEIENQALVRPVQNFVQMVGRTVAAEKRISLQAKDRALFLNSVKLRLSSEEFEVVYDTCDFFEERGMGGFIIDGSLDAEGVRQLLRILVYAPPEKRRFAALEAELKASGLPFRINKTLGTRGGASRAEAVLERRGYAFFTYSKLVVLYRSLLAEEHPTASRRHYLTKKIARTIQALIDICLEDDHTFLGIASVKSGEAYAPHHAANTAVLAIALGEKIGLRKVELADLGMAAVFHDIGLRSVPAAICEKKGPLDPAERALVEQHPLRGVEFFLTEQITRTLLSQIVAIFDHHREVGGGGTLASRAPSLLSRIVAIASVYDASPPTGPGARPTCPTRRSAHARSLGDPVRPGPAQGLREHPRALPGQHPGPPEHGGGRGRRLRWGRGAASHAADRGPARSRRTTRADGGSRRARRLGEVPAHDHRGRGPGQVRPAGRGPPVPEPRGMSERRDRLGSMVGRGGGELPRTASDPGARTVLRQRALLFAPPRPAGQSSSSRPRDTTCSLLSTGRPRRHSSARRRRS